MYQKGVVQDIEIVVHDTQLVTLCHFIRSAFPGESFIIQWVIMGADVNGLPVLIRRVSFTSVKYMQIIYKKNKSR